MAFHVACPITCNRICFCALGFHRNLRSDDTRDDYLLQIARLREFVTDPSFVRVTQGGTVQVPVPKVAPPPPPPVSDAAASSASAEELLSAQTKRAALQRRAAVASLAAEDFARRFESGDLPDAPRDVDGEEQGLSGSNVMCRLCFSGENEGSERAKKMLSCKSCNKKYHRSCVKTWAQNRDLFHWSSWTCPSCRTCEVCRRTGDPNKFKFCRRCDAAYHCYCMQPPHKNISSGPYLCPNHTRCHSCDSNVPGNGLSLRWFLGYTCCDACGRLFTKGNYCPVCLRVYRDSESTPMVCCDICQRWVHCECDNISDEKYQQFQADGNLPYTCPTCRGECYQVKDLEDAVRELWRRRDEADRDQIAALRSAAGLPTQDDIFSISPFSDDEDYGAPGVKNDHGRVKLSLKGLAESSPKKSKDYGKKSSNKKKKKGYQTTLDDKVGSNPNSQGHQDVSAGHGSGLAHDVVQSHKRARDASSSAEGICSVHQRGALKRKSTDVIGSNEKRPGILQIKRKVTNNVAAVEDAGKSTDKKNMKTTKLVIHLGGRNRSITNSPKSDSSNYQRELDLSALNGGEAISDCREGERHSTEGSDSAANHNEGYRIDSSHGMRGAANPRERKGNVIRLGKGKTDPSPKLDHDDGRGLNGAFGSVKTPRLMTKRSEGSATAAGPQNSMPKGERTSSRKHPESRPGVHGQTHKTNLQAPPTSHATQLDSKPLLKLKFKTPNQGSWISNGEEEKGIVKGQRSKRKRPSEKMKSEEDDGTDSQQDNIMNEIMDANWILKKLGKDAIGKRVEVQQQSDNSWHKGIVSDVVKGTSMLSVDLDDGRSKTVELGTHGIRFVPQKHKRPKL